MYFKVHVKLLGFQIKIDLDINKIHDKHSSNFNFRTNKFPTTYVNLMRWLTFSCNFDNEYTSYVIQIPDMFATRGHYHFFFRLIYLGNKNVGGNYQYGKWLYQFFK